MNIHGLWKNFPPMEARLKDVSALIQEVFNKSPSFIRNDLESLYANPGKMLRPAFLLLSSSAGDKSTDCLISAAASVELLHGATLIHDDVIDNAPFRRGRPTIHSVGGAKRAVLVGDYLLARSLELASEANSKILVKALTEGVARLCISEINQDFTQGNLFISKEEYFERIRGKTAELFALSCFAGAHIGGADEKNCDEFYKVGLDFGLAFQIIDDVLDYRGNGKKMGKRAGGDLIAGIPTLPLILALESGHTYLSAMCRSRFRVIFSRRIRKIIIKGMFDKQALIVAEEYRTACITRLKKIKCSEKDLLVNLIDHLKNREF